jgi:hypothetical protein
VKHVSHKQPASNNFSYEQDARMNKPVESNLNREYIENQEPVFRHTAANRKHESNNIFPAEQSTNQHMYEKNTSRHGYQESSDMFSSMSQQPKPSSRVTQNPGGSSSFQIGHGYQEVPSSRVTQNPGGASSFQIGDHDQRQYQQPRSSSRVTQNPGGGSSFQIGDHTNEVPSTCVRHAPGGASSFTIG